MAAVFLVTLYEYSPLFSIAVVCLCFFVTAAMLLGWFGFDVPVILRSHEEPESGTPTPEKPMVRVTNPFALDLGPGPASVSAGVSVRPCCLEPCILSCFWGCEVSALQWVLQAHQHNRRLSCPQNFKEALHPHYQYCQRFQAADPAVSSSHHGAGVLTALITAAYGLFDPPLSIGSEDSAERHTLLPADLGITDFGPLPRERYPLVSVLTVAEATDLYNIVASVTVIHVPDDKYKLSARVLFQYLLTSQGGVHELKPLFMSADSGGVSGPPPSEQSGRPTEPWTGSSEDSERSEGMSRDCVICQNAAVNRVLLPCRHACVCERCVAHCQHCPICRAFVLESFLLGEAEP